MAKQYDLQQVKLIMLRMIQEVSDDAFKVEGAINGNDLQNQGFYQFKRDLTKKVEELKD